MRNETEFEIKARKELDYQLMLHRARVRDWSTWKPDIKALWIPGRMITDRQIIGELAAGGRIICCDEGDGYSYKLIREQFPLTSSQVIRLMDEGWIYSSNTAYFLTDEGKKSYLKSTDELGDGRLLAPKPR